MNLNNFISLSRSFARAPITAKRFTVGDGMQACVLRPLPSSPNLRVLELTKVPVPTVCAGDVLVRVHASSINPLDNQMRFGYAKSIADLKIESPLILGRECSGVIEKIGNNVWNFKVGDEIVAATAPFRQGSHAEYIAVDESEIALKPKNLSHVQSASLPFNSLTAWNAISIAQIQPGMKVLVLGGSGRVGFTLVSLLLSHFRCHVTTTSSPSNSQKIISLGLSPDNIIDHSLLSSLPENFYDAVFDVVGTSQSEALCVQKIKKNGSYITFNGNIVKHADNNGIAGIAQAVVESTCKKLKMIKQQNGVNYGYALFSPSGDKLKDLMKMAEKGILVPDVGQIFSLDKIEQAYEWNGSGKVIVTMPCESQNN